MRQDRLKLKIIALVAFAIGILFFNSQKLGLEARKGREVNLDSNVDDVLNSDELAQLSDLSSSSSSNTESLSNTGINAAVSNSTKYKKYFTDCKHVMRFKASCQINIKSILEKHTNVEYYKYLEDFVEFAVANEEFQLKDNLFIESISDSSEISDESELEYGFSNSESFEEVDMTDDSYTVSSDNSNENSLSSDTSSTFNNSMSTSSSSYSADSASLSGGFEGASMGAESSYEQGKSSSYGTTIAGSQNNIVSSSEANANANSDSQNKIKNKEKGQSTSKSKNQKNVNRQSAARATAKARTVNNVLHNQFKKSASVARKHVTTTSSKEMELTKYNEDYLQYYINLRTYLEIDGLIFETNTETYFYSSKTNDEKDALMKECERELEYRFDMQPDNYMVDTGYQDFCLPTIFEDEEEEITVVDKINGMNNQIATLNQEIVQLKPALDKAQIKLELLGMGWFNIQNSTSQDKFLWVSEENYGFQNALDYCENLNDLEIFQENKDYFSDKIKMHEPSDPNEFPNFLRTLTQHGMLDYNTHRWRINDSYKPSSWEMYGGSYWVPAKRSTCGYSACPFKWISDDTLVDETPGIIDTAVNSALGLHKNGINSNVNGRDCLVFYPLHQSYDYKMLNSATSCDFSNVNNERAHGSHALCEISIKKN